MKTNNLWEEPSNAFLNPKSSYERILTAIAFLGIPMFGRPVKIPEEKLLTPGRHQAHSRQETKMQ